ncbi:transporter [Pelotomaculum propionicicum]|uniref:transporter n=1 Tax=Pelotomaculum propionicicum TaxID=258475 RepID=UPI003B77D89B
MPLTLAVLIFISIMWVPVALLFLGKGEAKGTGAVTGVVGVLVVICALVQATPLFKQDVFGAGLLFAHGILYISVSHALLTGLEDMRSVGNVSLTVAVISAIYCLVYLVGTPLVPAALYLALMCAGYTALTVMVWLNAYGKFAASSLAYSLLVWAFLGLWIPSFTVLTTGNFPF